MNCLQSAFAHLSRTVGPETRQFSSVSDFFQGRSAGRANLTGARRENAELPAVQTENSRSSSSQRTPKFR